MSRHLTRLALTASALALLALGSSCKKKKPAPQPAPKAHVAPPAPAPTQVPPSPAQAASHVFTNAKVYTVNPKQPWAQAVAVKGNQIVYVGDNQGAKKLIGKGTKVHNLRGKLLLPGFVSGHEHPITTGALSAALQIPYSENKGKMLAAVRAYVKNKPNAVHMSFGGSFEGRVDITRHDIDKIISAKPFLMLAASGHGAWVNSKALEAIGVVKGRPDPIDGFQRNKDGTPTGYLSTGAAAMFTLVKLKLLKKAALLVSLPKIIADYNRHGLTAVFDAGCPPGSEPVLFETVSDLEKQGRLNLRISASVAAQRQLHLKGAFATLKKLSPRYRSEMFTVNTLKIHGGSVDGRSAPLLEPYSDRPGWTGPEIFPPAVRNAATLKAARLGYMIHTHVIGDRAIRETLDAFQKVREAGLNDVRLTTGHSSLIQPVDIPRYKKYNVTANTFASKAASPDKTWIERLGKKRVRSWQRMKSLVDQGVRLAMSADAPTAPLDPFLQIEVAVLRKEPSQKGEGLYRKEEGLTVPQVIEAYTMGSAYEMGWEKIIGSLEVGKRADLIVASQNIFKVKPARIHKTKVLLTMIDGRVVYRR